MYQYALVKMLHNTQTNRFHPIYYYDSPFPGGFEDGDINNTIIRYKSKGHHTSGYPTRDEAISSANFLVEQLKGLNDIVAVELDEIDDIIWNDEEIPIDIQLRPFPKA